MPVCFLTKDRKGVDLSERGGREGLGGGVGREIIIRLYCMKKYFQ